jgi:hypothetical protein
MGRLLECLVDAGLIAWWMAAGGACKGWWRALVGCWVVREAGVLCEGRKGQGS